MADRRVVRCRRAWLPEGVRDDVAVVLEGSRVVDVRPGAASDGDAVDGLVAPGLVNGHTHLVESEGPLVPGGDGFLSWLDRRIATGAGFGGDVAQAARSLRDDLGVAWVSDVATGVETADALADAGLAGVAHLELLGMGADDVGMRVALAEAFERPQRGAVVQRVSPHALFSTAGELVQAAARSGPGIATLHVGESADEARFLASGDGPHAELLDRLGRDWGWWDPPGMEPIAYLDALGVLGPDLLLVHGVHLGPTARRRAAERGAPVCFCARSNANVVGELPDVPGWIAAGARCVLGTDGRTSAPDHDVLAEIPVLAARWPEVPPDRWLAMVTHEGAAAVQARGVGTLVPGSAPGLLQLDVGTTEDLRAAAPGRRWLALPDPPDMVAVG